MQELSGWDRRTGFELGAWRLDDMSALKALDMWKAASYHYNVIMGRAGWSDIQTVGCGYRNHYAYCWFTKKML